LSILFLGDSLTEYGNWRELFPGLDIRNRGIAGDTTDGVLHRLDGITALNPDKIFLMIGINDLLMGRTPKRILANYKEILSVLKRELPRAEVYVQSLLPVEKMENVSDGIIDLNGGLKRLADENGCNYINLFTPFSDPTVGINPDYTDDGLHLTPEGYAAWKREIREYL